jgi:hypothetical protein
MLVMAMPSRTDDDVVEAMLVMARCRFLGDLPVTRYRRRVMPGITLQTIPTCHRVQVHTCTHQKPKKASHDE